MFRFYWLALLLGLSGCPSTQALSADAGTLRVAAVGYRDFVPDYQQWASQAFAEQYFGAPYSQSWFLTATTTDPKKAELQQAVREAATHHDVVDLFLFAHGNHCVEWVKDLAPGVRNKLRLVYNTGGGDADQGPAWLSLGAKAYVGHPGDNVAPVFVAYFLPQWTDGKRLDDAVRSANRSTHAHLYGGTLHTYSQAQEWLGGRPVDRDRLWRGTEAQLFGSRALTITPAPSDSAPR